MSRCRFCNKPIPSLYKDDHEKWRCLVARKQRGELIKKDVIIATVESEDPKQKVLG